MRNVVGVGNDRAGPLEDHRALEFFCQFAGRHEPVGLHLCGCGVQQPRCLQRMRGEHRGALPGATRCQRLLQGTVGADDVQCIGVQHQRLSPLQHRGQHGAHRLPAAATAHHAEAFQFECLKSAQHQFGLCVDLGGMVLVQQADQHSARSAVQCCGARQQGGAGHPHAAQGQTFSAHDGHIAIAALVAGMQPAAARGWARQPGGGGLVVQPGLGGSSQVVPPYLPCGVPAVGGEQSGL